MLVAAHARASARGTSPSSSITLPQFDLTRCAATREKANYAVNERVPRYIYIYIAGGGEGRERGSRRYCPKEKLPLIATSTGRLGMKLGFTTGADARGDMRRGRGGRVHGGK